MFEEMISKAKDTRVSMAPGDVAALNPLVLAYMGDAIYEVYVREFLISSEPNRSVHKLHIMSTGYVKAHAQSEIVHRITPMLSEEELGIIRRGRNSKSGNVPKNADVIEYRTATGFEALVGYLYLCGNMERLKEILGYSISKGRDSD